MTIMDADAPSVSEYLTDSDWRQSESTSSVVSETPALSERKRPKKMTVLDAGTQRRGELLTDFDLTPAEHASSSASEIPAFTERKLRKKLEFQFSDETLRVSFEGSIPAWLAPTVEAMGNLLWLEEGWDSYGGAAVDIDSVFAMLEFLVYVLDDDSPAPSVVPTCHGGVQAEWHRCGVDIEIETTGVRQFEASFKDVATGKEWDGAVTVETPILIDYVARLA